MNDPSLNQETDHKNKSRDNRRPVFRRFSITLPALLVLLLLVVLVPTIYKLRKSSFFHKQPPTMATITESRLEKVIKESKLYTAEYPYNSCVTVSDKEGLPMYYVAYNGTIRAGFDADKVKISIDENKITIHLPPITVTDVSVDEQSLDYIFENKVFETETVASEAYRAAHQNLWEKSKENADIIRTATDNAKRVEKMMIEPWVNQTGDAKYEVEVLVKGEKGE